MKTYKKSIAILMIMMLALAFAGCGSNSSGNDSSDPNGDQIQDAQSQTAGAQVQTDDTDLTDGDSDTSDDIWGEDDLEDLDDMDGENADDNTDIDSDGTENSETIGNSEEPPSLPSEMSGDHTGSFSSDTGTALNLNVQWAANEDSDGSYDVKFQFFLDCYSLTVSDRSNNKLEVKTSSGTKTYTFKTKEVTREDASQDKLFIGETSIKMSSDELTDGANVKAVWDFRGSYSGTDLPEVTAEGKVKGN